VAASARLLPREFPPWSTVYDYFRKWRTAGVWEQLNTALREQVRQRAGRQRTPSAAIIDSQSVKATERGGPHGYDGGKKVNGRKRHILVDTLGLRALGSGASGQPSGPGRGQAGPGEDAPLLPTPGPPVGRFRLWWASGDLDHRDAGLERHHRAAPAAIRSAARDYLRRSD
jgi:hypothetical protein